MSIWLSFETGLYSDGSVVNIAMLLPGSPELEGRLRGLGGSETARVLIVLRFVWLVWIRLLFTSATMCCLAPALAAEGV